jgi:hypothetical protein
MIEETSTKIAPWHLVPANNKPFGRLAAFTILIDRLGQGLSLEPQPPDPKIAEAAAKLFNFRSHFTASAAAGRRNLVGPEECRSQ